MARMDPDGVGQEIEEALVGRGGPPASRPFVARGGLNVLCVQRPQAFLLGGCHAA
jgi:hypothetical protein